MIFNYTDFLISLQFSISIYSIWLVKKIFVPLDSGNGNRVSHPIDQKMAEVLCVLLPQKDRDLKDMVGKLIAEKDKVLQIFKEKELPQRDRQIEFYRGELCTCNIVTMNHFGYFVLTFELLYACNINNEYHESLNHAH